MRLGYDGVSDGVWNYFTTYYISVSVFLAYGVSFPNMRVMLYFIIPIKMSWMSIFYGVMIIYEMISYIRMGAWFMAVLIVASLLNFVIYFLGTRDLQRYNPKEVHRRKNFAVLWSQRAVPGRMVPLQSINVPSAAELSRMIQIWNFVSVPNAMAIMNTVRTICLPIHM